MLQVLPKENQGGRNEFSSRSPSLHTERIDSQTTARLTDRGQSKRERQAWVSALVFVFQGKLRKDAPGGAAGTESPPDAMGLFPDSCWGTWPCPPAVPARPSCPSQRNKPSRRRPSECLSGLLHRKLARCAPLGACSLEDFVLHESLFFPPETMDKPLK